MKKHLVAAPDGWLDDTVIDAVNNLVRMEIGGHQHQSTLLAQHPSGFDTVDTESIHVLHDKDHWIATACIADEVLFADSMGIGVSEYVGGQMKQLYSRLLDSTTGKLKVTITPCPRQTNASDCGVYASAVAFEWATGNPKIPQTWNVPVMRQHLLACLEGESVLRFPQGQNKRGRRPMPHTSLI